MPSWFKALSGSSKSSRSATSKKSSESLNSNASASTSGSPQKSLRDSTSGASTSAASGKRGDRESKTVTAIPIPIKASASSSTAAGATASSTGTGETDDVEATLEKHTATYGSSPSHAHKKSDASKKADKRNSSADSVDEPYQDADESPPPGETTLDGASDEASTAARSALNGANKDVPTTQAILSNPMPTSAANQLANTLEKTSLNGGTESATAAQSTSAAAHSAAGSSKDLRTFDIDDMIARLLEVGYSGKVTKSVVLKNVEITAICQAAREIFLSQPTLIELTPPVKIVGDVHGQYSDLIRLFEMCGFPPSANYLFLGDYVDRGKQSLETILLLLCYKIKFQENFFLLRGNHECANVTRVYGFYDECKRRCNLKIWKTFVDLFNCLPVAAIVATKIFCVHGGLSPSLSSMDDIRRIARPTDVPDFGLLNDLLWSDPSDTAVDWEDNERGVSYCFGKSVIQDFLVRHDFDLICRAHMVVEDGYEFWNDRTLVTIFSAPNYCGDFDNFAAVMSVSDSLLCAFELLKPLDGPALKREMIRSRRRHQQQLGNGGT